MTLVAGKSFRKTFQPTILFSCYAWVIPALTTIATLVGIWGGGGEF